MAPDALPNGLAPCVCVLFAHDEQAGSATLASVAETIDASIRLSAVIGPGQAIAGRPDIDRAFDTIEARGAGLGAQAAAAVAGTGTADLVLACAGAIVGAGWLEGLADAATEPLAANVFALTASDAQSPGAVDLPAGTDVRKAARCVADIRSPDRPRVPTSRSPVAYLKRAPLMLIGAPDESLVTWDDLITDLAQRAVLAGFVNVLAGEVLVEGRRAPASGTDQVDARFPWLAAAVEEAEYPASPPRRAAARASRAVGDLTVTLDCRSLGPVRMGTQTHALGLALALADVPGIRLRALVAHDVDPGAAELLRSNPATTLLGYDEALAGVPQSLIVHRPQQVNTADDLALLANLGERLVVTHQDLIGYRNPGYHDSVQHWLRHRRATRYALGIADRVLFFSRHARDDAVSEDLVDPGWTDVVGLGVDEIGAPVATRPASLPDAVTEDGFLLCLGADLRHKNLPFAIDVWRALCEDHGWGGHLVLAGPHVPAGSSRSDEEALLAALPELGPKLVRLGPVSEAEKQWLLERTAAVLYPTVDEGFGLLPFEAARAGSVCAHAGTGVLGEVLSDSEPLLVPWDASASAGRLMRVLCDKAARRASVEAVRRAGGRHTWKAMSDRVTASYERALSGPRRAISWEARDRLAVAVELEQLRGHVTGLEQEREVLIAFRESVGEDGARLVGPHPLLGDADRRALLAVVARPALRRPFLAALRLGYRLGHR